MAVALSISGVDCYKIDTRNDVDKTSIDTHSDVDNSPAPVLYYQFEEGTGTTVEDLSESDNDHDATFLTGALLTWDTSAPAQGTASVLSDDTSHRADVADHADLDFDYDDPFTFAFWQRCEIDDGASIYATNWCKRYGSAGSPDQRYYRGLILMAIAGKPYMYWSHNYSVNEPNPNTYIAAFHTVSLSDGNWHHIVWTHDGTGGGTTGANNTGIGIFVDGAVVYKQVTDTMGSNSPTTSGLDPRICNSEHNHHICDGLDELAIWRVALTPDQVETLYNSGATADCRRGM